MRQRRRPSFALATALARSLAIGLVTATAWSPVVRAEPPAREAIGALPLGVDGELAATWRGRLEDRLREGLARGRRPVIALEAAGPCDAACVRGLGRTADARWITRARVTVRERDFDVLLELLDARSGEVVTRSAGTCEVCAIDEVGDMLADRAGVLDRKLDALAQAPAVVRFETRPTAALLWLDGEPLGAAPLERSVPDGRHRARAELRGHLPVEVQFDAVAGTNDTVTLELSPAPRPHRALTIAGWSALGVGIAVLAGGVPLLVVHDRPYRDRCAGADVDADGDCRFRYDTRTGGAIAVAIGGAAIAGGIALLVRARRPAPRRARVGVRGGVLVF